MATEKRKIYAFPGKYKSQVWESFGFYMDDQGRLDRTKAICRMCRRAIAYSGNTTNLHNHVSHHHPEAGRYPSKSSMAPIVRYYGYSIDDNPESGGNDTVKTEVEKVEKVEKNTSTLTCTYVMQKIILEFLINDLEPLETLDSKTLRGVLKAAGARQELPGSEYFSNILLDCYGETRQKVMTNVSTAKSIYLKLDTWKAHACERNMLTVSAQVLQSGMQVRSYVLQNLELPESYTHADLSSSLGSIFSEWNIPELTVIVSADSKVISDAAKKLHSLKLNCLIDSINSAVKESFKKTVIERLMKHARKLVHQFTENSSARSMLHDKQKLLSLPHTKLKMDSVSWKSTYEMLDSLQEQAAAIYAVVKDPMFEAEGEEVKLLSASEQTLIQNLLMILRSLMMAVSMITDMSHPSAAIVLPVLKKLETTLIKSDVDSQVIAEVKKSLWAKLSEKYSTDEAHDFLLICSLLDPRYKDMKFVESSDKEKAFDLLKQELTNIAAVESEFDTRETTPTNDATPEVLIKIEPLDEDYELTKSPDQITKSPDQPQSYNDSPSPVKKPKLAPAQRKSSGCADWLDDVVHDETPDRSEDDAVTLEISRFQKERQMFYSSPLSWWEERKYIYPLLFQIASKYLSAPAVLKPSDSKQELIERKRQSIAPDLMDYMVFLNANYLTVRKE